MASYALFIVIGTGHIFAVFSTVYNGRPLESLPQRTILYLTVSPVSSMLLSRLLAGMIGRGQRNGDAQKFGRLRGDCLLIGIPLYPGLLYLFFASAKSDICPAVVCRKCVDEFTIAGLISKTVAILGLILTRNLGS